MDGWLRAAPMVPTLTWGILPGNPSSTSVSLRLASVGLHVPTDLHAAHMLKIKNL